MYTRHEMLELIVVDGKARGIIARDMVTGEIETHFADVVVLASGGYGNVFFLSTNAMGCNVTAIWRAHRKGAYMANPCYTQIHPTCIPVSGGHQSKLTLMSESLRNDGRIWVPKNKADCDEGPAARSPRRTATTTWSGSTPRSATWSPATSPPAPRRTSATRAAASAPRSTAYAAASTSTSPTRSSASAATAIEEKYGNLFDMYARITGEDPYEVPMRIYPAVHYIDGRPVGRLRPAVHDPRPVRDRRGQLLRPRRQPARRLRADAGPGRRLLRAAAHHPRLPRRRARSRRSPRTTRRSSRPQQTVEDRIEHFLTINGTRTVDSYHRELGNIMWEYCGMERTEDGLSKAIDLIRTLSDDFWRNVKVPGTADSLNQSLEKAGRVADFFELGELMCIDALQPRASPAAATSAPSRRPRTARRCATTTSSPTSRPGSAPATASRPSCTRKT